MEILKFPDPKLFTECREVRVFGKELKILLEAMWDTMVRCNGIGLAANQVSLDYKMFVMVGPSNDRLYVVNPEVIAHSKVFANYKEGCLSAPGEMIFTANRYDWVQIKFQDETGKECKRTLHGLYAVCAQHEIEHLYGKSFLESPKIPKAKRKELANKWGIKLK